MALHETLPEVTRVEVIDDYGRSFSTWGVEDVELHTQDEGRTLKIFVSKIGAA